MTCRNHKAGECVHPEAVAAYGSRPSAGICGICPHYDGPPRGAGDIVHSVAVATGIAAAAAFIERKTGKPCGCAERRAALNASLPLTDTERKDRTDASHL